MNWSLSNLIIFSCKILYGKTIIQSNYYLFSLSLQKSDSMRRWLNLVLHCKRRRQESAPGLFTKHPLLQYSNLTGGGSPKLEGVEGPCRLYTCVVQTAAISRFWCCSNFNLCWAFLSTKNFCNWHIFPPNPDSQIFRIDKKMLIPTLDWSFHIDLNRIKIDIGYDIGYVHASMSLLSRVISLYIAPVVFVSWCTEDIRSRILKHLFEESPLHSA